MSDSHIKLIAPLNKAATPRGTAATFLRQIPISFLIVVVAPVLAASFYFLLIATPRYVAEAKFVVRSATERQPVSYTHLTLPTTPYV